VTEQLADLTGVETADVYKAAALAARLARTPDGVLFSYVDGYDGPPVATTLPQSAASVARPGGALPAYFAGLLPEGRRLGALRRAVKTSLDDELSLLLAVGSDTIGDVQVLPAGMPLTSAAAGLELDPGSTRPSTGRRAGGRLAASAGRPAVRPGPHPQARPCDPAATAPAQPTQDLGEQVQASGQNGERALPKEEVLVHTSVG
jgi:HipA-like protein